MAMAPVVLCVAEKPSIATSIAAALAPPQGYSTRRSFQDVHEFFAPFRGQQARIRLEDLLAPLASDSSCCRNVGPVRLANSF